MARFNLPLDRHYASLATPRVANLRRARRSAAVIGANERVARSGALNGAFFKFATTLFLLTVGATVILACKLAHSVR
jgi:hypothetical protein